MFAQVVIFSDYVTASIYTTNQILSKKLSITIIWVLDDKLQNSEIYTFWSIGQKTFLEIYDFLIILVSPSLSQEFNVHDKA